MKPNKFRIQYISDIHLELYYNEASFSDFLKLFTPSAPILICAGDIGNPYSRLYFDFFTHIKYLYQCIIVIAGNHEFYNNGHTIEETHKHLEKLLPSISPHIIYLNNSYFIHKDLIFYGTTLWSHIYDPKYKINDVSAIKQLNIQKYNAMHKNAFEMLQNTLNMSQYQNKHFIIITHHVPLDDLIHPKYISPPYNKYNQWFAANMKYFFNHHENQIILWIYGHTHDKSTQYYNDIPCVCNPIGYLDEIKLEKNTINKVVEICYPS